MTAMSIDPEKRFDEGLDHFKGQNYLAAINIWQDLRESGFQGRNLQLYLHAARLERSKITQHIQACLDLLNHVDGDAPLRAQIQAKNFSAALETATMTLRPPSPGPELKLCRAHLLSLVDRHLDALKVVMEVHGTSPENVHVDAKVLIALGQIHLEMRRHHEAEDAFLKVVNGDPGQILGWYGLTTVYYAERRLTLAAECIKKVLASKPGDLLAVSLLDEIEAETDSVQDLIDECRQVLSKHPTWPDWHYRLGVLLLQTGDSDEAIRCFDAALGINPRYLACLYQRANLRLLQGDGVQALADLRQAGTILGDSEQDERFAEALRLEAAGEILEAAVEFGQNLELEPDYAARHIEIGKKFFEEGLVDQACREIVRGIEIKPDYPDAHYYMALIHRGRNETDEAVASLQKAIALNPRYMKACVELIETLLDAGLSGQAEQTLAPLRQILERRPDLVERLVAIDIRLGSRHPRSSPNPPQTKPASS